MTRRRQNVVETLSGARSRVVRWLQWARDEIVAFAVANPIVTAAAVAAIVRACGVTVATGQTGLKFSFGRVTRRLEPGFHPLIPFLQVARVVPTRLRTIELEPQAVVTEEGLVFHCRANLVWRIDDLEKALIEVDNVERGMRNMLAVCVQEVLHGVSRARLHVSVDIDAELEVLMGERLAPWGVVVERAGFQSIAPSPRTIRVTQLRERVAARHHSWLDLVESGLASEAALGLLGTRHMPRRRAYNAQRRDGLSRRTRRANLARKEILLHGPPEIAGPERGAKRPVRERVRTDEED